MQRLNLFIHLALASLLLTTGCATSQKGKIAEWSVIGASLGGAYGFSKNDYKNQNAALFSALGALTGIAASLYFHDPDKKIDQLEIENTNFKRDLEVLQSPKVIIESPATFNTKIPDKYKKLINPGEWRVTEIDQWSEESENRLIHQDKIMELIPPTLNPVAIDHNLSLPKKQ